MASMSSVYDIFCSPEAVIGIILVVVAILLWYITNI